MKIALLGAVVGVNVMLLVATKLVFDAWVRETFGYLDVDSVGVSGLLWVPLVMLATALAFIGLRVPVARWAAGVVIGALAFIVIDHVFGALRDSEVALPGAVIGCLMVLQLAALTLSVVAASRPDSHGVTTMAAGTAPERPDSRGA